MTRKNIDPRTGLPLAPEGYEWRVESVSDNKGFRLVLIKSDHKRFDFGDSESIWGTLLMDYIPQHKVRPRHFRKAARVLLKKRAKRLVNEATGHVSREKYVGVYPPKKLEA